ncbi:TerC family protein [Nocardioides sp. GY 10113]|uniref:TerC family protein n=1 Tax=Nocardioides sp. GY 10113 TaxID=2569761 RepID=UPI0010A77C4A|nr:TerC family protein [Nocardioides sp. GY 10113]TIC85825.1 TerC family protein [Nocardioides sp. GY 10113]
MDVSALEWTITLTLTIAVLAFDVWVISRDPHEPTMRECTISFIIYMAAAAAFGVWVMVFHGHDYGVEFFTGFLVEKSLSVDNLFVFLVLMSALKVPLKYQQEALMVGIILALVFRGVFIAIGYTLVENFSWVFYVFGAFLIYTAVKLVKAYSTHEEEHPEDNAIVTFSRRHLNVGTEYRGLTLWWRENGVRVVSPMLIVIIALGVTDVLFALDSIPAIFGVTQEPYLVFTANVFALMGLRQLYFLLGGLLKKLVYLSLGLAFILAFIGVKLVLHALHENELSFINGGEHVSVPEISSLLSLAVIIVTLVVTAVASLVKSGREPEVAVAGDGPDPTDVDDTPGPDWR